MSSSVFIIAMLLLGAGLYISISRKWKKRETELNNFAYEMQRDFAENTVSLKKGVDYYKTVHSFYEEQGYTISKHPDFSTDFIAKKEKSILFIRVQSPMEKSDITAKSFQTFIGQTVLYAMDNPLYENYELAWTYVCSKMMCDKSARLFINKYQDKLKFELIEAV